MTTINETLAAIDKLHRDAREIELQLQRHVSAERDPARHARWHRLERLVGELRAVLATPVPASK